MQFDVVRFGPINLFRNASFKSTMARLHKSPVRSGVIAVCAFRWEFFETRNSSLQIFTFIKHFEEVTVSLGLPVS
jgi:hypothetical protein